MVCKICGATIPDKIEFCPNCGAVVEKKVPDIPLQEAPEDTFDPEDGTTVLTDGMSGPLVADDFVKKPREHQPQRPEGKVETPAPVTGSSILSDEKIVPPFQQNSEPKAEANPNNQQSVPQPQGMPQQSTQQAPQAQPKQPQGAQNIPKPQFNPQTGAPLQQQVPQQMQRPMGQPMQAGGSTISGIGYFGYMLLFSIPLVGLIIGIVFAVSHKNKNVKNFAIGWLLFLVFAIVLNVAAFFTLRAMGIDYLESVFDFF